MDIVTCLVLAVAVAAASFTIARTKVTAPFRAAVLKRSKWFGALVSCPYCVSHWLAAGAVAIYRPRPVELWTPVDVAVAWIFTVAVSAAVVGVIGQAIAPAVPSSAAQGTGRVPARSATDEEIDDFKHRAKALKWDAEQQRYRPPGSDENYHPDMVKGDPYSEDPRPSRTS